MSESVNLPAIFPPERTNEYLKDKSLPEFLRRRGNHCLTYEHFLKENQTNLDFLERNRIANNPYKIGAESFEFHFQELRTLYNDSISEDLSRILNLIRYERKIHEICQFTSTQDVSVYLKIAPRVSDENTLCELISLMDNKHLKWENNLSHTYLDWIHFLTPYITYLGKVANLEGGITNITSENLDLEIKNCLKKLDETLVVKETGKKFAEFAPTQFQDIQQEISLLRKQMLVDASLSRIKGYYYTFGLCTFLQSLLTSQQNNSDHFTRLCIKISLYFDKLKQFEEKEIKEIIGTSDLSLTFKIENEFYFKTLNYALSKLTSQGCPKETLVILKDLLEIIAKKNLCDNKEFKFLETIQTLLCQSKTFDDNDDEEDLLQAYLSIIKQVTAKSDLLKRLAPLIESKNWKRLSVLDIYYNLKMLCACEVDEDAAEFQKNMNFSRNSFENLNHHHVFTNLKYSFIFIKTQGYSMREYSKLVEEKLQENDDPNNLKYFLIFLMKLQTCLLPEKRSSILKLSQISDRLDIWDFLDLQTTFHSILSSEILRKEEPFVQLVQEFEEIVAQAQVIPEPFLDTENKNIAIFNLVTVLTSSMQKIKETCDLFYECLDLEQQKSLMNKLVLSKNKFVYFVRTWSEYILQNIDLLLNSDTNTELLLNIDTISKFIKLLVCLFFHPALAYVCNDIPAEKFLLNQTLSKVLTLNSGFELFMTNLEENILSISKLITEKNQGLKKSKRV